jgi:transposase
MSGGGSRRIGAQPWQSGGRTSRNRGNRPLRKAMNEFAWFWLGHQPDSALSRWFQGRVVARKGGIRRIAIIALGRELLVALWRCNPEGG